MKLDSFQLEAIACIEKGESVLVSAPTGSGKTLIAERVIEQSLEANRKVIYTSPIKALSNQKYRDFSRRYENRVGIITGDVNINPHADILIMTTEIFRNRILDRPQMMKDHHWIIFDEIHFLDDYERGTAWEESIMFLPDHMNILALSATVPNVTQMAEWIHFIHKKKIHIVEELTRPVPLKFFYQCNNHLMKNIKGLRKYQTYFQQNISRRARFRRRKHLKPLKPNRITTLIDEIKAKEYLPCIYFCFSRNRCEMLAEEINAYNFFDDKEEKDRAVKMFDDLVRLYEIEDERSAIDLRKLIKKGIGFHHAGMLPRLKETIEELFTHRLIKVIFTTETFALGINMPARAVIFDELRKFYGLGFAPLKVRDFYQMAGRAGRRGMDECGYVFARIEPRFISLGEINKIMFGKTESVTSQFNSTYATLLNLYDQLGEDLVKAYPLSLHYFQSNAKKRIKATELMQRKIDLLKDHDYIGQDRKLTQKGAFASCLYGYELPLAELYSNGQLDRLSPVELNVLIASFVYEPRKNEEMPKISKLARDIREETLKCYHKIFMWEKEYRTGRLSKQPFFHPAPVVEAFSNKADFSALYDISGIDEGGLIRIFRMTIQVLREMRSSPYTSRELQETAKKAITLINRDFVDAEAELKAG